MSEWETVRLSDVAELVRGVTYKPTQVSETGIGIMRTKNVQKSLDLSDIVRIVPNRDIAPEKHLQSGDTLISSANSWNLVGKCCYVDDLPERFAIGGFVTALRPKPEIDPRYLYRWFSSSRVQKIVRSFGNKTTSISNLNLNRTKALAFPLPPLEEQRRIASILDEADAIRAKRRAQIAHLDGLPQALFHQMFNAVTETQPLRDLLTETRYGTSNKSSDHGTPTLRIPNVVNGSLDLGDMKKMHVSEGEFARLQLLEGDILFVRSNGNPENTGRCAVFDREAVRSAGLDPDKIIYASYLIRARLSQVSPTYVCAFMESPEGRRQLRDRSNTSAGQYNLNSTNLGTVKIPIVPAEHQRDFANKVAAVKEERDRATRALEADNELFAALQHRAFCGEL